MTFGQTLQNSRISKGIGVRELARQMSLSAAYVSDLERGNRLPAEETCIALAQFLEIDADELLVKAGKVPSDLAEIILRNPKAAREALLNLT